MRSIILVLYYIVAGVISIPILLIEVIIRLINKRVAATIAQTIARIVFGTVLFISGAKTTVVGLENIPKDTPCLYAANHRGFFDILLIYHTTPRLTAFISKKEIKYMPVIGQYMYFLNCLFMNRGDLKQSLGIIKSAIDLINDDYSVYIAPEGTRNATDELLRFKEGSMKIATRTNCPIVPVCLHNTEESLEKHLPWIKSAKLRIEYGKPIYPADYDQNDRKHIGAITREIIQKMYDDGKKDF